MCVIYPPSTHLASKTPIASFAGSLVCKVIEGMKASGQLNSTSTKWSTAKFPGVKGCRGPFSKLAAAEVEFHHDTLAEESTKQHMEQRAQGEWKGKQDCKAILWWHI